MVKPSKKGTNVKRKVQVRARASRVRPRGNATPIFGPVTTIDTAPVSIGNSFQGAAPIITPIPGGQRIRGRDFLINVDPTGVAVTGWTLVAGAPITPVCMVSSGVKSLMQMYGKYCVNGVAFHYITSCTTGDAGSVMMYIGKDRGGPGLNTANANFMPVVLSDGNTVISPVWKNCSAVYHPPPLYLPSDTFNSDGLHEQAPGEIFVYTKLASVNIPGYLLVDYDLSFVNMQVNLKSLSLPVARMKYTQVRFYDAAVVNAQVAMYSWDVVGQFLLDGTTNTVAPTGSELGDIYKIIINVDDGYVGAATLPLSWQYNAPISGGASLIPATSYTDGATVFGVFTVGGAVAFYPNYYCASVLANPLIATAAAAAAPHGFVAYVSLVGSVGNQLTQSNY